MRTRSPGLQFRHCHNFFVRRAAVVHEARGRGRRGLHQRLRGLGGALVRRQLEVARRQQEKREHAHRVVIDRALAGDGGPQARQKGRADAERHRHVHAGAPVFQVAPRRAEKGLRRIQQHRQRQQQADPVKETAILLFHARPVADVQRHRQRHDLHAEDAGHAHAAQQLAPVIFQLLLVASRIERMRQVADAADRLQDVAQVHAALVPAHARPVRGVIDVHLQHAGHLRQMALVEPDAGGAGDAFEDQRRLAHMLAVGADETFLDFGRSYNAVWRRNSGTISRAVGAVAVRNL
jgi:hypothetical protein